VRGKVVQYDVNLAPDGLGGGTHTFHFSGGKIRQPRG
jgi:hypothetical protein